MSKILSREGYLLKKNKFKKEELLAIRKELTVEPFMAFKKSKTIVLFTWGRFPQRSISLFITFGMCIGIQILMKYFSPEIGRRDFPNFVLNENKITE